MDAERESDLILLAGDRRPAAARAGRCARGRGARDRRPGLRGVGEPRLARESARELVSALRGGGIHVLERASGGLGGRRGRGDRRDERLHRRLHWLVAARLRGRSSAASTPRRAPRFPLLTAACAGSATASSASSFSTTRRRRRRSRASPRRSGPISAASAWRSRSPSTGQTSSCTATATAARSPARSTTFRSSTWASPS